MTSRTTLQSLVDRGVKLTPMMQQYYEIKQQYEDSFLLFRMGDFYEVFFEDAENAAKLLNITLTHRGKLGDTSIPMAGIPHHAAATYIDRLTGMGLKVAICEQIQDPSEAKGIVKRGVTQVVSPGMPFDMEKANSTENHFMVAASYEAGIYNLVAADFTTGDFIGSRHANFEEFVEALRILSPREFITFMGQWSEETEEGKLIDTLLKSLDTLKTHLSQDYFTASYTEIYTEKIIPTFKRDRVIGENQDILSPIGALCYYMTSTQKIEGPCHIKPFRLKSQKGQLKVTLPTLQGLEILPKNRESYRDSLLGFFDKTKSAMGARLLRQYFENPLMDLEEIGKRQKMIAFLQDDHDRLTEIREELTFVRDLQRILAKTSTGKTTSSDLLNTAVAIDKYFSLEKLQTDAPKGCVDTFTKPNQKLLVNLAQEIQKTINDEIGASLDKGNLIKEGANKERDKLAVLSQNAGKALLDLENRYREETGIPKLRVKQNNVAGYFIEVSKTHSDKVPEHFRRRQTLVNSERYTTEELSVFEKEVLSAKEKLERLEREIFKSLVDQLAENSQIIHQLAHILASYDVFQSLAWIAFQEDFVCPVIDPSKKVVDIQGGWHPLIKSAIKDQFVPHNITLTEDIYFGLITGPNMAGKTTVMREMAIVQLLAQLGSYVPAKSAELGLCDFLFSRLGASDDILKGQSTFMVEMAETAEILRHATERSLIILDEVGRGTSTYDGMSIAWALVEHLVQETKALTLFATHYHELIDLAEKLPAAKNLTVETKNVDGDVQFLYNLVEQGASQSFGIYVAKLAGLPVNVLKRSEEVLHKLEVEQDQQIQIDVKTDEPLDIAAGTQFSLFGCEPEVIVPKHLEKIEKDLIDIDITNMTPMQALFKLNELKEQTIQ